ncbi:MAG TPA: hypothetical protein VM408_02725 [Methylomirabilota bacterium]|nr:hypothetical protein [Methylomirabilota bacterium]
MAQALLRRSSGNNPSHRVVRIDVLDDQGSYTITYDDGTGESMIVD